MPLQGVAGSKPSPAQLSAALRSHRLFLYFGHGGGEQYVPLSSLKRLDRWEKQQHFSMNG
jgi:separase